MTNKLTLTEQEELFAKDCKLINLKYEYNGYTGDERWAIITELSVKELWEKYPLVIERYSPFVHLSIAQGEVIDDANRNEDKYAKRSSRTLDCYGYDDEMSSQFHKELAIMFDDPFEKAEEERLELEREELRQCEIRKARIALSMLQPLQRESAHSTVVGGSLYRCPVLQPVQDRFPCEINLECPLEHISRKGGNSRGLQYQFRL